MGNITEYLKKISNARYGKDVRASIVGALEQCYVDATEQGNANMEVVLARGVFDNLKERLNTTDQNIETNFTAITNLKTTVEKLNSYSTEEKIVGTYKDNKKIYRKRLIANLNSNGTGVYINKLLDIDMLISIKGFALYTNDNEHRIELMLPYEDFETNHYIKYNVSVDVINNTGSLGIFLKSDYYKNMSIYFWIEYTKLTDTVEEGE